MAQGGKELRQFFQTRQRDPFSAILPACAPTAQYPASLLSHKCGESQYQAFSFKPPRRVPAEWNDFYAALGSFGGRAVSLDSSRKPSHGLQSRLHRRNFEKAAQ